MKNSKLKYFTRLELENVRAFGTKQVLDLTDGNGAPSQWTVLLGDNGVGKTTLLQCLAWMRPSLANDDAEFIRLVEKDKDDGDYKTDIIRDEINGIVLVPDLQNEYDNDFLKLLVKSKKTELNLIAFISNGKKLAKLTLPKEKKVKSRKDLSSLIVTGVNVLYEKGKLSRFMPQGNTKIEEDDVKDFRFPFLIVYGANRYLGIRNLSDTLLDDDSISPRLINKTQLYDAEEMLQLLDYASLKKGREDKKRLKDVKLMLVRILRLNSENDILINPPATSMHTPIEEVGVRINFFSGDVPLSALSLGYKTTLALILDLAWRLYQKYPKSKNPLNEPAIVLIDEIDLHLHPKFQLEIMDDLSELFPATQFIGTAHSPLIVQSSPTANFAVLQKQGDEVAINNDPHVVTNWRVDQILNSELFGLTRSRDEETDKLIREKYRLLDKDKRTPEEEKRLNAINEEILQLPTQSDTQNQKALDFIQRASDILKKHGVTSNK